MTSVTDTRSGAANGGCSGPAQPHLSADLIMFGFPANSVTICEAKHHGSADAIEAAHRVLETRARLWVDASLLAQFRDEGARYSRLIADLATAVTNSWRMPASPLISLFDKDWTAEFEALPPEILDRAAPMPRPEVLTPGVLTPLSSHFLWVEELYPFNSDTFWANLNRFVIHGVNFCQIQHLQLLRERFEGVRRLLLSAAARVLDFFFSAEAPCLVAFASRCRQFYLTHGAHPPKVQLQLVEGLFIGRTFQPLTVRG